jgi:hypothetical protein
MFNILLTPTNKGCHDFSPYSLAKRIKPRLTLRVLHIQLTSFSRKLPLKFAQDSETRPIIPLDRRQ